jgi:hypothetical protein
MGSAFKEYTMNSPPITCQQVAEHQRLHILERYFNLHFPVAIEPAIYTFADHLAEDYHGGYWHFYTLSNGGFYMAPMADEPLQVNCDNGYEGQLSADAFGIVCCLYAYSHLSFSSQPTLSSLCATQFHALDYAESAAVLAAID